MASVNDEYNKYYNQYKKNGNVINPVETQSNTVSNVQVPDGYVPVRNALESAGYNVGFDNTAQQATVNGVNTPFMGSRIIGDKMYAPYGSIANSLTQNAYSSFNPQSFSYNSPYSAQIEEALSKYNSIPEFNYNSNQDKSFQQASKNIGRNVMAQMNDRNILNSSITGDKITEQVAQIYPQYEQMAYQRYTDNVNRQRQYLNDLLNMDEQNYNKAMQSYKMEYDNALQKYNNDIARVNEFKKSYEKAYDEWNDAGYATNNVATILGVAPGTPSAKAKSELNKANAKIDYLNQQLENQKSLAEYKNNLINAVDQARIANYYSQINTRNAKAVDTSKFDTVSKNTVNMFNKMLFAKTIDPTTGYSVDAYSNDDLKAYIDNARKNNNVQIVALNAMETAAGLPKTNYTPSKTLAKATPKIDPNMKTYKYNIADMKKKGKTSKVIAKYILSIKANDSVIDELFNEAGIDPSKL